MISFIIIGRNEGWKLSRCFQSVFKTIKDNSYLDSEIIYVDSKSTDDSIERAIIFGGLRIISLTGDCNAAIARNIGAIESKGNTLFFIDGDMEIKPDFLPHVYSEASGLKYNFVSGQFINFNYDYSGNFLDKAYYFSSTEVDTISYTTGGLFLIKKEIWNRIGGMKNKLKRSQDIDLGLRLAKIGFFLYRRNEVLAIHHTISYLDTSRTWRMLLSDAELYRSVLFRDNIFNKYQWLLIFRENYSAFLLGGCIIISVAFSFKLIFISYFFAILIRAFNKKRLNVISKFNIIMYYMTRDFLFFLGLFFFWPINKKNISYKIIQ